MPFRQRDPNASKSRILQAARAAFADQGFAGASMSAIAEGAGESQGLIHHHFGSKDDLWKAVLIQALDEAAGVDATLLRCTPTMDGLRAVLRAQVVFFRERPDVLRLLQWSTLQPSPSRDSQGHFDSSQDTNARADVIEFISRGQAVGAFRTDLSASQSSVLLQSAVFAWVRTQSVVPAKRGDESIAIEALLRMVAPNLAQTSAVTSRSKQASRRARAR